MDTSGSTAQHSGLSMAQHGTAQHSLEQHSLEHHSTAQHINSTAQQQHSIVTAQHSNSTAEQPRCNSAAKQCWHSTALLATLDMPAGLNAPARACCQVDRDVTYWLASKSGAHLVGTATAAAPGMHPLTLSSNAGIDSLYLHAAAIDRRGQSGAHRRDA